MNASLFITLGHIGLILILSVGFIFVTHENDWTERGLFSVGKIIALFLLLLVVFVIAMFLLGVLTKEAIQC